MAKIQAAKLTIDLEARSQKFSEALDRAQRQAGTSSNAITRSLGKLEQFSKKFEKNMSNALWAPFHKFKKAMAPFTIATRQLRNTMRNLTKPFKDFTKFISGPFIRSIKKARSVLGMLNNSLTTIAGVSVTGAIAAFTAMTVSFSKSSLEMRRWANMIGISYQELNELQFAANEFGITNEQLADGMKDLTAKIEDAAYAGSGALLPFFTAVNEKASDWQKLNPTEQLMKFSEHLSKMDYKTALYWADEVNGAMAEMAPLLYKGKQYFADLREEAKMFGASIAGVDNIKKIQSVFTRIKYAARNFFTGVGATMAPGILTAFDNAMNTFKDKLKALGDGDASKGFEKFVENFSIKLIEAAQGMFSGIDVVVTSISSAFDAVTDTLNGMKDLPFLNGKKTLTATSQMAMTDKQRADVTAKEKEINTAKYLEMKLEAAKATLDDMPNGWGASREEKRDYQRQESSVKGLQYQLLRLANKNGISGKLASKDDISNALTKQYNHKVDSINTTTDATYERKSFASRVNDVLEEAKVSIKSGNWNKESPEQIKAKEDAAKAKAAQDKKYKSANENFDNTVKGKFKGRELALDAYKESQLRYIAMAKETSDKKVSIEQKAQDAIKLIQAGSTRDIALEEAKRTDGNKAAIDQKIADIKANTHAALEGIKIEKEAAIKAEDAKLAAKQAKRNELLEKENTFQDKLRQLKIKFGMIEVDDQKLKFNAEQQELNNYYDNRLANLSDLYSKESDLYKAMTEEKKAALDELLAKQQQEAEQSEFNGNGFFDMFNRVTETKANAYSEQQSLTEGYTNTDITAAKDSEKSKLEIMKASGNQMFAEGAKHSKKMFKMQKGMKIANALMNTFEGVSAALKWGMPMGPIFAAMIGAQGMMNVNMIRQQQWSGQAHDGIDSVPNTGTWNLEKGERVTDKRTNADLKKYLYDQNNNKQEQSIQVISQPQFNGPVTESQSEWFKSMLAEHQEDLAYNMRQASSTGYF